MQDTTGILVKLKTHPLTRHLWRFVATAVGFAALLWALPHINRYSHAFSGGQRQRIGIARALIMRPALCSGGRGRVGPGRFRTGTVINLLEDLQDEFKLTYNFVAHDLSVVRHICDRVAVMYAGRIVELADTEQIFAAPRQPVVANDRSCAY